MEFRNIFKKKHVILPVIHCESEQQTFLNVKIAVEAKADGVFLINHAMDYKELLSIYRIVRENYPELWIGLNLLDLHPTAVFKVIDGNVDGIWVDNAMIDENSKTQDEAEEVLHVKNKFDFNGLYFGGFAFKYQRNVVNLELGARTAKNYMDVVTTSGPGTGKSASIEKIQRIRAAIGDFPLAIASGITPENIKDYLPFTDCFLVATGISHNFTNLDEYKVCMLMDEVKKFQS